MKTDNSKDIRPLFAYFGSKWNLAKTYPMPKQGQTLIEPFAGSACFAMWCLNQGWRGKVILNEADNAVAGLWKWMLSVEPTDIMKLPCAALIPGTQYSDYGIPSEAQYLIARWMSYGSGSGKTVPDREKNPEHYHWSEATKFRLVKTLIALRDVDITIRHGDYLGIPNQNAFWFLDPPYRTNAVRYTKDATMNFAQLGAWVRSRVGQVVVCEQQGAHHDLSFRVHRLRKSTMPTSKFAHYKELIYTQGFEP